METLENINIETIKLKKPKVIKTNKQSFFAN